VIAAAPPALPPYHARIAPLSGAQRAAMTPSVWRPGCPVPLSGLRRVTLTYVGFDGRAHRGAIVVGAAVAAPVARAFGELYAARFPIRRMRPISAYGGSDDRSMAADNTSGFNCRYAVAAGPKRWSVHAYGKAIDVNPVENPYLEGGRVLPPAGRAFVDRARVRPGMATAGGVVVGAFASVGWLWGGRWSGSPDWQHFSATGG
jgi:hypothetical protein